MCHFSLLSSNLVLAIHLRTTVGSRSDFGFVVLFQYFDFFRLKLNSFKYIVILKVFHFQHVSVSQLQAN